MESQFDMYLVGGATRDRFLGIKSKDLDYVMLAPSFEAMEAEIVRLGGTIFLSKPEFLTVRAIVPELGAADFVLPRADGNYSDGRRPDSVTHATLWDDLSRRDFTMNAIAINVRSGEVIDPFNGRTDINIKLIRTVGRPADRFGEDGLRILRAMRFAVQKGFAIETETASNMRANLLHGVSLDRQREEMQKMFRASTINSLHILNRFPDIRDTVFANGALRLEPTLKD